MIKPVTSLALLCFTLSAGLTAGPVSAAEREQAEGGGDSMLAAGPWQTQSAWQGNRRQQPNQRQQPNERRRPESRSGGGFQFNYTHITAWSGTETLDDQDPEGDFLRLEGAINTGGAGYLYLSWQEGEYEAIGERSTRELGMGFQEHYAARTSFFITAGYVQDRWDAITGGAQSSEDRNLLRGRYGLRTRLTDRIELDGAIVYSRGSGSTDIDSRWSGDVGLSIYFTEQIALRVVSQDIDGLQPSQALGLRFEFSP